MSSALRIAPWFTSSPPSDREKALNSFELKAYSYKLITTVQAGLLALPTSASLPTPYCGAVAYFRQKHLPWSPESGLQRRDRSRFTRDSLLCLSAPWNTL